MLLTDQGGWSDGVVGIRFAAQLLLVILSRLVIDLHSIQIDTRRSTISLQLNRHSQKGGVIQR